MGDLLRRLSSYRFRHSKSCTLIYFIQQVCEQTSANTKMRKIRFLLLLVNIQYIQASPHVIRSSRLFYV